MLNKSLLRGRNSFEIDSENMDPYYMYFNGQIGRISQNVIQNYGFLNIFNVIFLILNILGISFQRKKFQFFIW